MDRGPCKRVSAVVHGSVHRRGLRVRRATHYDANDYSAIAGEDPGRFVDPIVSSVYEPGSVFKMVTAVAALQRDTVTPKTKIKDTGKLVVDDGRAHVDDADHKARGWMTFEDAVAYSRNVVAAKVALSLGKTTKASAQDLFDTWPRLGFGQPTGIDLASEDGGSRARPRDHALGADRPRERGVRAGRRGDARPARPGVRRDAQRRAS